MKTDTLSLIDFEAVNNLLEGFNQTTGFVTAILDLDGNVLSKSGWRKICTEFHRINPETAKNCLVSDTELANKLRDSEKYHFYECYNGLVDVAVPIVIKGEHIANLFSGQFFFKKPDPTTFKEQAKKYGFDEKEYLKALEDVPIMSKHKVRTAMGFLLSMTQLISDMTFQKMELLQLNNELSKSEERSRSTLDHMLEGCQIIGFDWRYIYLNKSAETHNRRPNSEFIGKRYMDKWPGIETTNIFKIIKQVLEKRVPKRLEYEFVFPDGIHGWFDLSIQPVPEGVFILSIDITERKKQEAKLFDSEFIFSKMFENGPFGMVLADKNTRFVKANPAFCSILGYNEDEIKNLTFKDVTYPEDLIKDMPNMQKLNNKEIAVYKTDKRYIRKDGKMIWGSLTVSAAFDSEGHFLNDLGIVEDITERKKILEELLLAKEKAEESDNLKTAFINNISHEIRTPLNSILGFGQFLSEPDLSNEQRKEYFNIIQKSSNRLTNTISDYIDMARIVTGSIKAHKKEFPLRPLFNKIAVNAQNLCAEKMIDFEAVIPNEPNEIIVNSDQEFILKVFNILIDNALKFTRQGCIKCGFEIRPGFLEFFVKDSGIGIPSEKLEIIFNMFSQADPSTTSGFDGSGLGLTIAKNLVNLLGGFINVTSESGKGSVFTFAIPCQITELQQKAIVLKTSVPKEINNLLVLIAEDDETNFLYIEAVMKKIGCKYIHAANGAEAVEMCKQNSNINLVLMDIKMPVMNGLEATQLIHGFIPELPIIATTAYAQTSDEYRFLSAGCNGYLVKPVKRDSLLLLLKKYA